MGGESGGGKPSGRRRDVAPEKKGEGEEGPEGAEEVDDDEDDVSFNFSTLKDKSCRVHDILIKGNVRTKEYVIEREMEGVRRATTLQELADELATASRKLNDLGIFEEVTITCDEGPPELPGTTANLIVHVKEKGPLSLHVGSYMQGREGSIEGSLQLNNYLGAAERFDCNAAIGQSTSNTYCLGFHLSHFRGLPAWFHTRIFQSVRNWQRHSSHTEKLRGLVVSVASGNHDVSYELTWRDLADSTRLASSKIRKQLGHSLLSAAKYTYALERRDNPLRPTKGYSFRSSTQVAGLGPPDARIVRFARQDLEAHFSLPLRSIGGALSFGIHGGFLMPWGKDFLRRATPISDRFFLGGASSLRGFRTKGIGPFDERIPEPGYNGDAKRDALGGDVMLSGVASLSFNLPVKVLQALGLHGHAFLQAGNVISIAGTDALPHPKDFLSSFRVSSGAGLVWPTKLGRLE
ncbi:hypothetical protein CBR_g20300 [Chara braunii]|uniref:POTRA domain-containing protein n=1 Tax=Chara braunii TaxID=69332 RepID=A0A388L0F0_CHABU|nr:hypothetical protein CBR_g20300 [Chara braunii]|eukprot:GBG75673.1 hypothetical protein CBR_g20300 [Chara braunii]